MKWDISRAHGDEGAPLRPVCDRRKEPNEICPRHCGAACARPPSGSPCQFPGAQVDCGNVVAEAVCDIEKELAEREGFEPSVQVLARTTV